jgi:Cu/Ag efflux protein CusF
MTIKLMTAVQEDSMKESVKRHRARFAIAVGVMLTLCLSMTHAQQTAKKEHPFRGTIQKIDVKARTLTVDGENVEGWMSAMTMVYEVDKDDVIGKVKAGDQITAKVYEGDYKTLHGVQVVPPKAK